MSKKYKILVLFIAAVLAFYSVPAMAAPPMNVHIVSLETIADNGGTFTITGAAVDSGLVCPTGTTENISNVGTGPDGGDFLNLRVIKRFTCDDLSGTFDVQLLVRLDLVTHYTTARWTVVDGTGDYASLQGRGFLVGTPIDPGKSISDVYDGTMK